MANNIAAEITQLLLNFFTEPGDNTEGNQGTAIGSLRCPQLLRFHSDNVKSEGDAGLYIKTQAWQDFCTQNRLKLVVDIERLAASWQMLEDMAEASKLWSLPLCELPKVHKDRLILSFQRENVVTKVLRTVLEQGERYGCQLKLPNAPTVCLKLDEAAVGDVQELRLYRTRLLHDIACRLFDCSKWQRVSAAECRPDTLHVTVQCLSHSHPVSNQKPESHIYLLCGNVLEPKTKSLTTLSPATYLTLRSDEMMLVAAHRHGVRETAKSLNVPDLTERLGAAAVIVGLFEVRHTSPAMVVRAGIGCSKGAPYILYNSARLETLLRSYNEQVVAGLYPALPAIEEIDFSLLTTQLDWDIIRYLLVFPEVVASTLDKLQQGQVTIHQIVIYVINLAKLFSRYYRYKKVLIAAQSSPQLMPMVFARVYLIKAVRVVLNAGLALLDIKPVDYM